MKKCYVLPILGETNAGKSTLVNALVGEKVSIVSRKVQTTSFNIMGVYSEKDTQLIFIDTPGFFHKKNEISYEKSIWEAFRRSDSVIFVLDSDKKNLHVSESILRKIDENKNVILVLNKIDLVPKVNLLSLAEKMNNIRAFQSIFMVSATEDDGVEDLRQHLMEHAPEGEWIFDEEEFTDLSMEQYLSEITREHIYDLLHQEIPYGCKVVTINVQDRKNGGKKITQEIYVSKESHKPIFLGKGGAKIKAIGQASRLELQEFFGAPVQLFLTVKVGKSALGR